MRDYAPTVFSHLRRKFGIDSNDFKVSAYCLIISQIHGLIISQYGLGADADIGAAVFQRGAADADALARPQQQRVPVQ